jgi:hypothetical protein
MTNDTPSDEAISAMVEVARMSGLRLNPSQRSELDGLIAHGLIENIAATGPSGPVKYAVTPKAKKCSTIAGSGRTSPDRCRSVSDNDYLLANPAAFTHNSLIGA